MNHLQFTDATGNLTQSEKLQITEEVAKTIPAEKVIKLDSGREVKVLIKANAVAFTREALNHLKESLHDMINKLIGDSEEEKPTESTLSYHDKTKLRNLLGRMEEKI